MRLMVLMFIIVLGFLAYGLSTLSPTPIKTVNITIPDSRINAHETRIQTLEEWAQRHGMKY